MGERKAGYRAGKGKTKPYRGEPYWEKEQPLEAATHRVALSYYPKAGKLQVASLWHKDGEAHRGKVVTIDAEDVQLNPAIRELLARVLEEWS